MMTHFSCVRLKVDVAYSTFTTAACSFPNEAWFVPTPLGNVWLRRTFTSTPASWRAMSAETNRESSSQPFMSSS